MVLLPLNFAKAAGWLFFIQVRHFVTQLLQIFLVSWGRLQKSKMEKAKVLSNSADHTIHFAFARFTLAGRGAACACCLGCALGLLLFLFFPLPLPGVWIQRLVCLVWFEGWHGHKHCSRSCCCKQHSAPVGLFIFFGGSWFFENCQKDPFKLKQEYGCCRKAKETGTMFERLILCPKG